MKEKGAYYAVAAGHQPGIYRTWAECQQQTNGYSKPRYKKFDNPEAAVQFLNGEEPLIPARLSDTDMVLFCRVYEKYDGFDYGVCAVYKGKHSIVTGEVQGEEYLRSASGSQMYAVLKALEWGDELCTARNIPCAYIYNPDCNAVRAVQSKRTKSDSVKQMRKDVADLNVKTSFFIRQYRTQDQSTHYMRLLESAVRGNGVRTGKATEVFLSGRGE